METYFNAPYKPDANKSLTPADRNPDDSDARQKAKVVAEMEAKKNALILCKSIFQDAKHRFELEPPLKMSVGAVVDQSDSTFVTTLLPSIIAHLPQLAVSDAKVRSTDYSL